MPSIGRRRRKRERIKAEEEHRKKCAICKGTVMTINGHIPICTWRFRR